MDQRNAPYGMLTGREGLPGSGMPQQMPPPQQPQPPPPQRVSQPTMQQHYSMQDMMFDPLPMGNGMYHPAAAVNGGGHMMHPHQPGARAPGGMQVLGTLMSSQQGMGTPEDDLDDLMSALGDSVGMTQQQQQQQNMGQHMASHVYDHLQPRSLGLQPGSTQGLPMSTQMQSMQQGMVSPMHMNQMPSNDIGAAARMGAVGMHQQPNLSAPSMGGLGGLEASNVTPVAPRPQAPVAPNAIVPTLMTPKFSDSSRTLTTSSNNGGSSDEDIGMGEGDDAQKKKERRRQQVRYASRRRRKKQKDEESFLRDRIAELKEQIRIIGGDLTEQCSQMAGMSEQALTEAYEKQMVTVQTLRKDNNKLKEQLLQHENFARMIQYGLNALPSDCRDVDRKKIAGVPMWISDQMNPLKGPTLVVDLNLCHEAVRHAYNELKTFGPTVNSKTNVCYAMGWKTELWAASTCLNFRAVRSISDKNIREVANASWDIITSPEKFKRIYPDVKQFRILQKVTDDIVVVHRIVSVASDLSDREFISVAFRFRDGDNYFIGLKSITVQTEAAENCIRGEECQGWMFLGDENETPQWKAHFLGYYDVKGEKDDKVLNQLANESMFGMLRWESEAMHPLSA